MSIPILTFFNNKGGVGKTSLVYHLAWMFASLRKRVLLADLDPQANLTAALLNEAKIEDLWESQSLSSTIYRCVKPLTGVGDIIEPTLQKIADDLYLIPGDVSLSSYEDTLSTEWPNSMWLRSEIRRKLSMNAAGQYKLIRRRRKSVGARGESVYGRRWFYPQKVSCIGPGVEITLVIPS